MAFLGYRSAADRVIDRAKHKISLAEMRLSHSYTDEDIAAAEAELGSARRYLERAEAAKAEWESKPRGDYEEFPEVPETDQPTLI